MLLYVCTYIRMSKHFRLWGSNGSLDRDGMCRNGGETMVLVSDRSVARGTSDRAKPCKKPLVKGAGQTNGGIRLKLGGPLATMNGLNPLG